MEKGFWKRAYGKGLGYWKRAYVKGLLEEGIWKRAFGKGILEKAFGKPEFDLYGLTTVSVTRSIPQMVRSLG